MELSSLLTESPSYSTIERYYTPSGDEICGETLIFSQVLQKCVVECIYPLYKENEITILYAIAAVFGYIGFLGNFFVCFTGLFRPSMRRYPNSNAYFLCFFSALSCFAGIWENLLGLRYVFCDDNVNSGSVNNWACVVDSIFTQFFRNMAWFWFCFFNFTIFLKLFQFRMWNSKWLQAFYWILSIGWNLTFYIVGLGFKELHYSTGFAGCQVLFLKTNSWYNFTYLGGTFITTTSITTLVVLLSAAKLVQMKFKTNMSGVALLRRQARLLLLWLHYICACCCSVGIFVLVIARGTTTTDFQSYFEDYVDCVQRHNGSAKHCDLEGSLVPFGVMLTMSIIFYSFPVSMFLFIGLRKQLFLFWVEYFKFVRIHKYFPLEFIPTFDGTIQTTTDTVSK